MNRHEVQLVGAGGLARDMAAVLRYSGNYIISGLWDDAVAKGELVNGIPVLGTTDELLNREEETNLFMGIGNPDTRKKLFEKLSFNPLITWPVYIDSKAILADAEFIHCGKGTFIFPGCLLTTNIEIGENVLVHAAVSLHHDTKIGNHSVVMPGARITSGAGLGAACFVEGGYCITTNKVYPDGFRFYKNNSNLPEV